MKISIIGAGNVGGLTAMRIAEEGVGGVFLIDISKGLAQGKAFDLEDARSILKLNYHIVGTEDIAGLKDSDIIVMTAGFARKPGMTREDLLKKNSEVMKGVCQNISKLAPKSVLMVVTNPLDIMTYFALKVTGFKPSKVFGMGISLDSGRFANLISKELNLSPAEVDAYVIGSHGEDMLPLPRHTNIKGVALDEFMPEDKINEVVSKTVGRGKEIVGLLGSGSAYFAPSAAIASIVSIIAKNEKKTVGACAHLNGEYGLKDICIGVPCRLGSTGVEEVIELDLNKKEKDSFLKAAESIKSQYNLLDL